MPAKEMLQCAFKKYKERNSGRVDVAKLARECGLSYSTVYSPLYKGRNAGAETWFKIMQALGAVKYDESGIHIDNAS